MIKKEDFEGQKMLVIPQKVKNRLSYNPFTKDLYTTDIGYYPYAKDHFRNRLNGSPENILILCTDGKGWIETGGIRYTIQKNQYFIIPKKQAHKYSADHKFPWTIHWIHFNGDKDYRFKDIFGFPLLINESQYSRQEDRLLLFEEMMIVLSEDLSDKNLEYSSILLMHLLGSLMYISQFRKIKEVYQKDDISSSIQFMKENLQRKLSLKEMAEKSRLSISHYSLKFKQKTSQSPLDYLTTLRIQKACSLLSFTDYKVKEIAQKIGFEDPYYFSRLFSKYIGKSPNQYRKEDRGVSV